MANECTSECGSDCVGECAWVSVSECESVANVSNRLSCEWYEFE